MDLSVHQPTHPIPVNTTIDLSLNNSIFGIVANLTSSLSLPIINDTLLDILTIKSPSATHIYLTKVFSVTIPVLLVFCILSILGNAFILIAVECVHNRREKTPLLTVTLSLAIADAWVATVMAISFVINTYLSQVAGMQLQSLSCYLLAFEGFRMGAMITAIMHLLLLAIYHYIGIAHGLHYPRLVTIELTLGLIIILWLVPPATLLIFFAANPGQGFLDGPECRNNEYLIFLQFRLTFSMFVFIPLAVMIGVYIHIFHIIYKSQYKMSNATSGVPPRPKTKAIVTTLIVLGTYVFGWLPAIIKFVLICGNCVYGEPSPSVNAGLGIACNALILCKCCLDPIIYASRVKEVRHSIWAVAVTRCGMKRENRSLGRTRTLRMTFIAAEKKAKERKQRKTHSATYRGLTAEESTNKRVRAATVTPNHPRKRSGKLSVNRVGRVGATSETELVARANEEEHTCNGNPVTFVKQPLIISRAVNVNVEHCRHDDDTIVVVPKRNLRSSIRKMSRQISTIFNPRSISNCSHEHHNFNGRFKTGSDIQLATKGNFITTGQVCVTPNQGSNEVKGSPEIEQLTNCINFFPMGENLGMDTNACNDDHNNNNNILNTKSSSDQNFISSESVQLDAVSEASRSLSPNKSADAHVHCTCDNNNNGSRLHRIKNDRNSNSSDYDNFKYYCDKKYNEKLHNSGHIYKSNFPEENGNLSNNNNSINGGKNSGLDRATTNAGNIKTDSKLASSKNHGRDTYTIPHNGTASIPHRSSAQNFPCILPDNCISIEYFTDEPCKDSRQQEKSNHTEFSRRNNLTLTFNEQEYNLKESIQSPASTNNAVAVSDSVSNSEFTSLSQVCHKNEENNSPSPKLNCIVVEI